jgi:hypothetical protein
MRLELKAIKYAKFMSQETACYEGKIYVDGKFFATAINEGQGGPDAYHRNLNYKGDWNAKFKEIDAFFARLPKLDSEYFPDGMEQTLELWCGKQLDRQLAKRDLYRLFKTKILYTEDGSTMYTTGFENNARIKVREPNATILNDLPFDRGFGNLYGRERMNIDWVMEQIDAYCDQIALEEADDDSDENYTKAYKAAYQDCLGHVLDEAKGRLGWD